ncbi:Protein PLASTID MOVEMENT IMPAIRED 2 [Glycine max]|nr:Protein PLASTID MOVEMENT IMPAIRED 2 [Glycine max]
MAPLKKYVKPSNDDNQYSQVMTELEHAKWELFQLKLHVGSVLQEKLRVENKIKASRSSIVAQKLRKEIEEASEEQLVVQLARMDAFNELRDIEQVENTRNKLKEAIQAIDDTKELEMKLATTLSDIDMLKNEFKFVNKTGKSYKLLRAKSKFEVVSAVEEKAKSIVSNLTQTLDKLKSEIEVAKKEKDLIINGEVAETKEEIKKALLEIKELEVVKSSKALALEKLKILRENAMKDKISNVTKPSSLIIISKFEYEYLRNHARKSNEIAEKGYEDKVVASQIQRFVTQKLPSIQSSAVWWTSSVEKVIMLYFLWMTTRSASFLYYFHACPLSLSIISLMFYL